MSPILTEFKTPEDMKKSDVITAKIVLNILQKAVTTYFQDNEIYPTTTQGLQALLNKPTFPPIPKNYSSTGYLERTLTSFPDPWGNPYQYTYQFLNGKHKVTIISFGADGKLGGEEYNADIISIIETDAN